jgi:hypothetical protein
LVCFALRVLGFAVRGCSKAFGLLLATRESLDLEFDAGLGVYRTRSVLLAL